MVQAGAIEVSRCVRTTAAAEAGRSQAPLLLAAIAALALGLLVYLADRSASQATPIRALGMLATGPLFGAAAQWLPSFVHPFAFGLLSAALAPATARPAYRACAAWWAVNLAFELGQHPGVAASIAEGLRHLPGPGWVMHRLADYFVHGRFDAADMTAATAGALGAAGVLWLSHRRGMHHAR